MTEIAERELYYVWDYDTGVVTGYERTGECSKCGACCLGKIAIKGAGGKFPLRGLSVIEGVWYEAPRDEGGRIFYQVNRVECDGSRCSDLSDDNLCTARDNGRYTTICKVWPIAPCWQVLYPDCGYKFEKVGEWPIED